jgi:hypothetical protein
MLAFLNIMKCRIALGFTSIDFNLVNIFNKFAGSIHFDHCNCVQDVGGTVYSLKFTGGERLAMNKRLLS